MRQQSLDMFSYRDAAIHAVKTAFDNYEAKNKVLPAVQHHKKSVTKVEKKYDASGYFYHVHFSDGRFPTFYPMMEINNLVAALKWDYTIPEFIPYIVVANDGNKMLVYHHPTNRTYSLEEV